MRCRRTLNLKLWCLGNIWEDIFEGAKKQNNLLMSLPLRLSILILVFVLCDAWSGLLLASTTCVLAASSRAPPGLLARSTCPRRPLKQIWGTLLSQWVQKHTWGPIAAPFSPVRNQLTSTSSRLS